MRSFTFFEYYLCLTTYSLLSFCWIKDFLFPKDQEPLKPGLIEEIFEAMLLVWYFHTHCRWCFVKYYTVHIKQEEEDVVS